VAERDSKEKRRAIGKVSGGRLNRRCERNVLDGWFLSKAGQQMQAAQKIRSANYESISRHSETADTPIDEGVRNESLLKKVNVATVEK